MPDVDNFFVLGVLEDRCDEGRHIIMDEVIDGVIPVVLLLVVLERVFRASVVPYPHIVALDCQHVR